VHTSAAAGAATVVWILLGTPLSLLIVPLIAWSRVRLRRHTLLQTVVGALLGFSVFLIALSLMQAG
jgi:membrane-associated phospholipid phosphatase